MPKSRRSKLVHLTQTGKHPKDMKAGLIEKIRGLVSEFQRVFVFRYDNMRTNKFKELRTEWSDSRFCLGRNKVMQVALGRTEEDEFRDNIRHLSNRIVGSVGLLFTNRSEEEVLKSFAAYGVVDYARSGFTAPREVAVTAGPLGSLPHTMLETLRKLGMPVVLDKGVIVVTKDHVICSAGDVLTPEQGRLLKLFEQPMAMFTLTMLCMWCGGKFEEYAAGGAGGGDEGGSGDEDDDVME